MELTASQKIALEVLASSFLKNKFYWTGGTLLSYYYLHHRYSYDLDFFSEEKFSFDEINQLVSEIKVKGNFKEVEFKKIYDRYEFLFIGKESLRVEFVYYNHEKKTLRKRKKFLGVFIDSLEDIATNKLIALLDRSEPKDVFDLYFIFTSTKISPQKLIKLVEKKFGVLVSLADVWGRAVLIGEKMTEIEPLLLGDKDEKKALFKKIKEYFEKNSKAYLDQYLR
jgi:predicted nucleotidyltransferase component of viral defense system